METELVKCDRCGHVHSIYEREWERERPSREPDDPNLDRCPVCRSTDYEYVYECSICGRTEYADEADSARRSGKKFVCEECFKKYSRSARNILNYCKTQSDDAVMDFLVFAWRGLYELAEELIPSITMDDSEDFALQDMDFVDYLIEHYDEMDEVDE